MPHSSTALEPLESSRRAEGVFEQLRARILSGAYPAGSRIPNERDLAEALRVNRASVREAVKRLEFLELVEVRHGQGTFVRGVATSSARVPGAMGSTAPRSRPKTSPRQARPSARAYKSVIRSRRSSSSKPRSS